MYGDQSGEFVCGYQDLKGLSVWKKQNKKIQWIKKIKPLEGIMI